MDKLIAYLDAERGRRARLAADLGIHQSALAQWKHVPALRVPEVSRLTGIPRHILRPDLYEQDAA